MLEMRARGLEGLLNILSLCGGMILCCTMFISQGEELNLQHFLLAIASTTLLCEALFIVYLRKYKFDIIDISIFVAYLYLIWVNEYHIAPSGGSDTYTIQLLFVLYFACRIIFYYFDVKHILICLLAVSGIFQSLVGAGQFLGILDSRHALFSVTGTFLNPGPFGGFLAVIGVIMVLYVASNYSLFVVCHQRDIRRGKKAMLFRASYYLSLIASIFIIIMLVLSGSRSALLGFVIPITIFILTTRRVWSRINRLRYKKALLPIGLLAILIIMTIGYYIRPESVNSRLHIWQVSLCELDGSVLIGTGIGTFPKQYSIAQEKFYAKHGFESNWVKYADTPYYAFNEFLNIVYETGVVGLLFFIFILLSIIKKQLSCDNNRIFAYGIISILIISFTSYPLHLIPISVVLVVLMSRRECVEKGIIPRKLMLLMLSSIFIFTALRVPYYLATVNATMRWEEVKHRSDMSIIEIREESDFSELYDRLAANDRFLLNYAVFLKNRRDYSRSIEILKKGHAISNNPDFALLLADINADLGTECEAEWYYKKAFMMVPNRLSPLYLLAIFYYDTGQYAKFRCLADRITNFCPKVKSNLTDRMKKDISDLLSILNEDRLGKSISE